MKRIILWTAFFVVIGLFVWGLLVSNKKTTTTAAKGTLSSEVTSYDWSRGSATSTVTLVEYSDFQCPACASYHGVVKKVVDQNNIHFVYRYFPLIQIHMNADISAGAAEAAGKQGKFWEMHDMLFDTQRDWENKTNAREIFIGYATKLGLNIEKFKIDIESRETRQKINDHYRGGVKSGVESTPSFFLNGKKISNPRTEEDFNLLIKNAIASSTTR